MAIHKLTTAKVAKLTKNGMYGDGGGLWLQVTNNGAGKSWVFRWVDRNTGRGRNMGLGPLYAVDIHEARRLTHIQWTHVRQGDDPISVRAGVKLDEDHKRRLAKTVDEVIDEWLDTKINLPRRAEGTKKGTAYALNHVRRTIGHLPIQKVDMAMIMDVVGLQKMWMEKNHKAARLQNYLERIFRLAIAKGYYTSPNPAQWKSHLEIHLPRRGDVHRVKHHPCLSYKDVGRFMEALRAHEDTSRQALGRPEMHHPNSALALEFIVLGGAVRLSEVALATWDHVDRPNMIWTVPAENHKIGNRTEQPILRPISKPMLAVLDEMERRYPDHAGSDFIFRTPSPRRPGNAPYHYVTLSNFVKLLKWPIKITTHGFRSTFTDWCRAYGYDEPLYEAQAGHVAGNKVAQAYRRDQLVDARRPMMEAWGQYCSQPAPEPIVDGSNITEFRRKA